jgi:intein/homing endonuclease
MPMFGYNARTNALVKRLEEDLGVQPHAIPTLNLVFLRKSETVPNDKTTNPPTKYDRIIRIDDPHDFEVPFDLIMDEFKKIVKDFDYAKAVGTINVRNLDRVIRLGTRESENIDVQIAINILTKFDGWRKSDLTQSMRILIDEMSYVAPSQVMLYAGDASRSGATISDFLKESRRDNASVDGASLDYTENVVIVDKGCLKQVRIGDLVDSKFASVVPAVGNNADFAEGDGSILVPAFDPDSLKIGFFPVTSFVRHLPKKLCEVKLERGKSIRPTFDESLFTLSPDGAVESVRVDCLKVGSFVACPSKLPQLHSQPKRLNLVDEAIAHFGDDVLSKLFIQPDNIRKFLIAKFGVTDLCKRRLDERHRLSLLSFKKNFERSTLAILDLEDARLGTCGCTNNVPVAINLDCDVYWLLGLIVADGNMSQNRIVEITCGSHELDLLEKASVIICRVFGVKGAIYKEYRGHECAKYSVSSSGLYWALRVLGVNPEGKGRRSKILHIPKLVLNASGDEIKAFLRGFWDGDGTKVNSRPKIDIGTTRLTIADELVHLFLLIGLNPFIYPQKTRRGIFYRVIVENTTITNLIRSYTKNDRLPCFNAVKNIVDKLHDTGIIKSFGRQKLRTDADLNHIYRLSRMWARRHTTPTKRTVHGILSILEKKPYYEVVRSQCESLKKLLLADIDWLRIKEIQEKQCNNYVYDLEVKIGNRKINNFVAGIGAVFCHNTQRPLEIITDVRDSSTNVFFRELPSSKDKSKSQIDFILESVQLYDPSVRPVVRDINNRGLLSNGTYWFWWNKQTRSINVLRPTPPTFCLQDPKKTPAQIIKMYEKDTGEQILLGSWDEVPELAHAVSEVHRERSIVN